MGSANVTNSGFNLGKSGNMEIFRDFAGIRMQSGRIRCLDPETQYSGMKGTKLQKVVVQEYLDNPQALIEEAAEIYKNMNCLD